MKTLTFSPLEHKLLINILSAPGWAKELSDIYVGGKPLTLSGNPTETEVIVKEFDELQISAVRKAIKYHAAEGHIPPSTAICNLFDFFGIQV